MRLLNGMAILTLAVLLLSLPVLAACGGDDEESPSPTSPQQTAEPTPAASPTAEPTATVEPTTEPEWTPDMAVYHSSDFTIGYRNPLDHIPIPQHPFLAPNGQSNMHNDAYMSDTYEVSGPTGTNPEVILKKYAESGVNMCVTITFDRQGRIVTTNAQPKGFQILLIDPDTLEVLATYALPSRDFSDPLGYGDTSGAAYFALDHEDRVIVVDAKNVLHIIKYSDELGEFEPLHVYDLTEYIVPMEAPARDHVQMSLPDWNREGLLWFMTRFGVIGTIGMETGVVQTIELTGEEMQNSFTVGEDGVYFVTDHSMYRLHADEAGVPVVDWRTEYDRGSRVKPSMINQGSGTTPQLFGDMIAIGDNADPQMHIHFLTRSDGEIVCTIPLWDETGTTENALPGFVREGPNGDEYSIIVENNYGKLSDNIFAPGGPCVDSVGGLVRIDLIPDGSGGYSCEEIWSSDENSCSTVPKLSLGDGLLYLHTYTLMGEDDYAWFLTTVDFETGKTVYKIRTGNGWDYNDFGAPVTLGPDGGVVYIGCLGGMISVRDGVE